MAKTTCKKCDPHELCEECPEWIFTLADLIMCMMGLFVILWVLKPGTQAKPGEPGAEELTKILAAIQEAFGKIPDPLTKDPVEMEILANQLRRQNGPGERGKATQESRGAEGIEPEVTSIRVGKQAAVGGRIGFDRGSATLTRVAIGVADQIVLQIRGHRQVVIIKGHTSADDFPEGASEDKLTELSVRRAQAVQAYLISKGVAADMLRVQGCSTWEPVQRRAYTPDLQAMNRRVEVEVSATLVEELQDQPRGAATTPPEPRALPRDE